MQPLLVDSVVATRYLSCVGLTIGSLELLCSSELYAPTGLLSWNVLRTQNGILVKPAFARVFDGVLEGQELQAAKIQ